MKYFIIAFIIPAFYISVYSQESVPGLSEISSDNLMKTVNYLASKECAGRLPGHEGYNRAARYMASEFEKLNLEPLGDSVYFQNLKTEYIEIIQPVALNLVEDRVIRKKYKLGEDFVYDGYSDSGSITAQLVFCGYGSSEPYQDYDDYSGMDVKNKIVLVFDELPKWEVVKSGGWWGNIIERKASVARQHGAIGILRIDMRNRPITDAVTLSIHPSRDNYPEYFLTESVAQEFVEGSGHLINQLKSRNDSLRETFSFPLNKYVEMKVVGNYKKETSTMNVVAIIPGSDSSMQTEYVVVGAHLDGQGSQSPDVVYPGANDNASGSAALLEIAKAFVRGKIQPKRSIVFVFFTGEEIGLIGSKYFIKYPIIPFYKIVAMINLDCIGYGDHLKVNGALHLWQLIWCKDSLYTEVMTKERESTFIGDGVPFIDEGIPTAFFITNDGKCGPNYHRTTDKSETLNYTLLQKVTSLAYINTNVLRNVT